MPKAILSVFDKTGLVDFAKGLTDLGWTLLASGGTAKLLNENGINAQEVADYTKSPEILGGRVKTLHPAVHGGLLARSTQADHQQLLDLGWDYIDLVAVNLYPFEATIAKPGVSYAEVIENIDIGGVTLIRAAAKNHERVTLVCDPVDYPQVLRALRAGDVPAELRHACGHTSVPESVQAGSAMGAENDQVCLQRLGGFGDDWRRIAARNFGSGRDPRFLVGIEMTLEMLEGNLFSNLQVGVGCGREHVADSRLFT